MGCGARRAKRERYDRRGGGRGSAPRARGPRRFQRFPAPFTPERPPTRGWSTPLAPVVAVRLVPAVLAAVRRGGRRETRARRRRTRPAAPTLRVRAACQGPAAACQGGREGADRPPRHESVRGPGPRRGPSKEATRARARARGAGRGNAREGAGSVITPSLSSTRGGGGRGGAGRGGGGQGGGGGAGGGGRAGQAETRRGSTRRAGLGSERPLLPGPPRRTQPSPADPDEEQTFKSLRFSNSAPTPS